MLRTLWFLANLLVYTTWYGVKAIVAGLIGVPNRVGGVYDECTRRWSKAMLRAAKVEVRVVGLEKLPLDRPLVYASNHQSWFDIFLLGATIPTHMRFVAKKELAKIPVLGRAMHSAGHIYIDRQNLQQAFDAYDETSTALRNGLSAVVFPEGTRSRTGALLPFKKGPFVLAIAAQIPLVPTYCAGTFTLLPKGTVRLRPHPIAVLFGEPIQTRGMTYDDRDRLAAECRRVIERLRAEAGRALR